MFIQAKALPFFLGLGKLGAESMRCFSAILPMIGHSFLGIIFVAVTNLPDIYAMSKNFAAWLPVNAVPHGIGDDYVYFSYMNAIVKSRFFSMPLDNFYTQLHAIEFYPTLALLLNIPAYLLGLNLLDQRAGILAVRLFNTAILFISFCWLMKELVFLGNKESCLTRGMSYFTALIATLLMCFGPYYSLADVQFLATHINNNMHVFSRASANELTRAIYCSFSGPVLFFGLAVFLSALRNPHISVNRMMAYSFAVFLVLSFVHPPIGYIYLVIAGIMGIIKRGDEFEKNHMVLAVSYVLLAFFLVLLQYKLLTMSDASQEARMIGNSISFYRLLDKQVFGVLVVPVFATVCFRRWISKDFLLLYCLVALFYPLSAVLGGGYGSRFWIRGAHPIFIMLTVVFILLLVEKAYINNLTKSIWKVSEGKFQLFIALAAVPLFWSYSFFFYTNSQYLYANFERITQKPELLHYVLQHQTKGSKVVSNSFDLAYFAPLYSDMRIYLKNYSLQPFGYKAHLHNRIIPNYKILGVTVEDFVDQFSQKSNQLWATKRPFDASRLEVYQPFYAYSVVFQSTLKEYNGTLIAEKMYDKNYNISHAFLEYLEQDYLTVQPASIRVLLQEEPHDVIVEAAAQRFLPLSNMERFLYKKKIVLDGGEITVLQGVTIQ